MSRGSSGDGRGSRSSEPAKPNRRRMKEINQAEVRHHFAAYAFGEPCTEAQLARAESLLGQPIPLVLRKLYLSFNGFLGPTDASFFWPLFEKRAGSGALVEMDMLLRNDH